MKSRCIYSITYKPHGVCVTVRGVAIIRTYIYNICTNTIYMSTWTGSSFHSPLHVERSNHTATQGGVTTVNRWRVFEKQTDYSTTKTAKLVTETKKQQQPKTGVWREFKGLIHQTYVKLTLSGVRKQLWFHELRFDEPTQTEADEV